MTRIIVLILSFLSFTISFGQNISCSPKDAAAFSKKVTEINRLNTTAKFGDKLTAIGKTFVGIPYVAKTLEVGEKEALVVNLHGLDCTTFIENVLAFALIDRADSTDFYSFTNTLEKIRYRDGKLNGYGSRLHYFTEWISNNESKGLVKNITHNIGGRTVQKDINFMGTHRNLYPFLTDDDNYTTILKTEAELKENEFCVLAQEDLVGNEHLLHTGDIIALATSINGLDVTHTGIAIREKDGRIHLLHASTGSMEVEITKLPLADYLKNIKSNIGIIVARPL